MEKQDVAQELGAPSFSTSLGVWARIGFLSFGGPAAQIALMHRVLVDERRWLDEHQYLSALSFCMLLPGPEAMQLATYSGWRPHGVKGGLAAGLLFVVPGAVLVFALSLLYGAFGKAPPDEALFEGVKAAVLAIVLEALWRVSQRALRGSFDWVVAAVAFVAVFFLDLPFPLVVAAAAIGGYLRTSDLADGLAAPAPTVRFSQTARTFALWLVIWIGPLLAVAAVFGSDHVLAQLAWFFSKLAVVTFGGAYAVLAYMVQAVVQGYGWLSPGEMLDGLGLAEATPGPLILVTEFVGYIAALRFGGGEPILIGLLGALVTLWATFAPCFLWIFVGAPYIEWLTGAPRLVSALRTVTAAVVGVILNLSVWFALHVLFGDVSEQALGPLRLFVPDLATVNWMSLFLSGLAVVLLVNLRRGIAMTLGICVGLALLSFYVAAA
ncbi:MAG: chromate efflux transporter [Hyphomicrobium sp.]|nr:chromate efflux transporter [Hyphomicrobium sp.]